MKQKSTKTTVTFRLDKSLKRYISKLARHYKTTPSAFIEQIVKQRFIHNTNTGERND